MIVAAIGFLFDTYELLMTPLVLARRCRNWRACRPTIPR
jgi:hypothetical protein